MTGADQVKLAYEERVRALTAALDRSNLQLSILSVVAERIHGEEEVEKILDTALKEILEQMGLHAAWVFMGGEKDRNLRLAASRGVAQAYLEEIRCHGLGECLCPEVFWSGHRMQARNTMQCPRMPSIVEGLDQPVAHACIPLRFEGETRGVLNVAAPAGGQFTDDELSFLETLGHQVCIAIERAGHLHAERRRNQEARAMAAINKAIGGSLDVQAVLEAVGRSAREVLEADRVHILLGADPRNLKVAHLSGLPHAALKEGQRLDLVAERAMLHHRVFEERRLARVDDLATDERVNRELAERWGVASAIVAPLVARELTLGLLVVTRTRSGTWSQEHLDVAEALAAQASVAIENARLYEEARRAYRELKGAQERILQTEKMAVLGTFASGLAHEVRNPLNSMALQLSLLERRVGRLSEGGFSQEVQELIGVIREEIKRLDALVGDFLLFSRANRIQYQPASLEGLIDEVTRLLRPEARESRVTLRRQRLGEPIPNLPMDVEKMKQVVINLLRNAIEAMPQGGAVTVESGLVDGQARIQVLDNGPGLPEGLDIFQLFVTTKPKGTGLGLSIAQQIILEHGGEITAESQPGKGASFVIRLPFAASGAAEQRVEP